MTIELDSTLAQAEVLFLSFSQIIKDIDRRQAEAKAKDNEAVIRRRRGGPLDSTPPSPSTPVATTSPQKSRKSTDGSSALVDVNLPTISPELRELLENWSTKLSG